MDKSKQDQAARDSGKTWARPTISRIAASAAETGGSTRVDAGGDILS